MAEMGRAYNSHPIVMGEITRVGLPGLRFSDGPRGVVMGESTAFPVSMAGGDLDVQRGTHRRGDRRGDARAGGNLFAGVCINLPRHRPGVGFETYSEDPLILGSGCGAHPRCPPTWHGDGEVLRPQFDGERPVLG